MSSEWKSFLTRQTSNLEDVALFWISGLSQIESYPLAFSCLDKEEKKRCLNYHFEIDQRKFANGRAVLKCLLAQFLGIDLSNISISYGEYLKPMLVGDFSLHFNVSHSQDQLLIALSDHQELGLDLEFMAEDRNLDSIAAKHFSAEESAFVLRGEGEEKSKRFYQIWTAKEALLKAQGQGLWSSLGNAIFPLQDFLQKQRVRCGDYELLYLEPPMENFQAALCARGSLESLGFYRADLQEILALDHNQRF